MIAPAAGAETAGLRILLLIVQFPPDVNSTGLLMAQVCEELKARGHTVDVITSFPHYDGMRVRDEYRGRLLERGTHAAGDVLRLYVYAKGGKESMLRRLLSYLSFNAFATVAGALKRGRYDVILCTNGSFFTGIAASIVGLFKRAPFVFNIQDLYPETPVKTGQLKPGAAYRLLSRLERFMYRRAEHVTVIAPSFRENLRGKGVPERKISVIPNFVNTEFIRPLPKDNEFARRHGLHDRFVVTHSGNLGAAYDFASMLEAADRLRDLPEILFLIIGNGVLRETLEAEIARRRLENVRMLPFQPREELPWIRASSDVQVSLYRRGSATHSLASKIYEIMASERPLLASAEPDTDVADLVRATGCGVCVEPEDADQLVAALLSLYRHPVRRAEMGRRGRAAALEFYSRQSVAERYDGLLRQVASRHRSTATR